MDGAGAVLSGRAVQARVGAWRLTPAVDLDVMAGGAVRVTGMGAEALLRVMAGVSVPMRGRAWVEGVSAVRARSRVAYLPGSDMLDAQWSLLRAARVMNALLPRAGARVEAARLAAAADALAVRARVPVGRLPWPERARAGLALTVARDAALFVVDEPFRGAHDAALVERVQAVLAELPQEAALVIGSGWASALAWREDVAVVELGGRA